MIGPPLGHPAGDEQTPRCATYEAKAIGAPLGHPWGTLLATGNPGLQG